ncbi:hypothetical protein [Geoalkalibacter sp.]|uniref:hypothetical protein n=1 Tax=Geoalkalibacter sp. TaxID=3041440 RepID=UPI00272EDA8F|nr:hypothetical protein [Geoalkalibacter sp.]
MKRIILEDYLRDNRAPFARARLSRDAGRRAMTRPRSAEERELLLRLDRARLRRWLREGRLEILGPRKFRLNF